jgi:ribosomal protein S19
MVLPSQHKVCTELLNKYTFCAYNIIARSCTILPSFVGLKFLVHNGKEYIPVHVTEEMIGHKLGEFSFTRKRFTYRFTKNK